MLGEYFKAVWTHALRNDSPQFCLCSQAYSCCICAGIYEDIKQAPTYFRQVLWDPAPPTQASSERFYSRGDQMLLLFLQTLGNIKIPSFPVAFLHRPPPHSEGQQPSAASQPGSPSHSHALPSTTA